MLLATASVLAVAAADASTKLCLQNQATNGFLSIDSSGRSIEVAQCADASLTMESVPEDRRYTRLRAADRDAYLSIEDGPLAATSIQPGWWSAMWELEPISDGSRRLKNRWKPEVYIHNQNGAVEAAPIDPGSASAHWILRTDRGAGTASASASPASAAQNTSLPPGQNGAAPASVRIRNASGGSVTVFAVLGQNPEQLHVLPPGQSYQQPAYAGLLLGFTQNDQWLGDPYTVSAASGQSLSVPYSAPAAPVAAAASDATAAAPAGKQNLDQTQIKAMADAVVLQVVKAQLDARQQTPACWRDSYGRGVGQIPTNCDTDEQEDGGLCYARCKGGYKDFVTMCVPECPDGFRDDGLHCFKPAAYQRAEYPYQAFDGLNMDKPMARCRKEHGANCVLANANTMVYETCRAGYAQAPLVTNLCSPQCPAGMTDIGVSCQKNTYDRGVGHLKACNAGMQSDGGLCYQGCNSGHDGIGPVCWAQCPKDLPVNCGAACAASKGDCATAVTNQVTSPFIAASSITLTVVSAGSATGAVMAAKGAASAGKAAATIAASAAAKSAARASAKIALKAQIKSLLKSSAATTAKVAAKQTTKELSIDLAVGTVLSSSIWGITNAVQKQQMEEALRAQVKKQLAEQVDDQSIDAVLEAMMAGIEKQNAVADFPWSSLDPTGVADIVLAYNLPMCSKVTKTGLTGR
ncbi:RICIN domain-containing protein [Nevskia ramosa]|uniref:RICIN domain-containing protein n=1 Tax=Nevskia ramosa TaxID=64002 RepID=UPI002354FCE6|nr:hypothetical protein [Nevskia ramosa]